MNTLVLLANSERWHIATMIGGEVAVHPLGETLDISPGEVVALLVKYADSMTPRIRSVVICPPPHFFVAAPHLEVTVASKDRRTTLLYKFEEVVPLAAEDLVADFVWSPTGTLGVGAMQSRLTPLLDALQPHGFRILGVCPAAFLAARHSLYSAATVLELDSGLSMRELVALASGVPTAWGHFEADTNEAAGFLAECNLPINCTESPRAITSDQYLAAAAECALDIAIHQRTFPVDTRPMHVIRQDRAAALRLPRRTLAASAVMLVVSFVASQMLELRRAERLTRRASDRELAAFHSIYPNQTPPPNIRSRLESAVIQARQIARETSQSAQQISAICTFGALLQSLPKDKRFRVNELRVSGSSVQLSGHVPSHADADQLARGIAAKFTVAPLRTELLSGNIVSFAVSANLQPQSSRGLSTAHDRGEQ